MEIAAAFGMSLSVIWALWWQVTFAEDGVSGVEGFLLVVVVLIIFSLLTVLGIRLARSETR